ncbi:D-2-hydroxyacid dehydrogenase family protein [Ottowia thiooxydans]|uniref:D-2-hydroxyacid dehydrogenase family protein n=1 Tax=Ottowia thiooxydans TaxID=219182 RepID=UPI000404DAF1|nr:D-2-hydroxyacid dehydrogenase family protein [Ottowia thiooxydans]
MTDARPRVVVLDDWEGALARLTDWTAIESRAEVTIHGVHLEGPDLIHALKDAECVVLFRDRTPVNSELLAALPRLQRIISTGTRNQKLDVEAAAQRGIDVRFTEWGPSKASTCEMTWSLILACARRLPQLQIRAGQSDWRRPDAIEHLPQVLAGKTLGLIGLGQIGQRVAAVGQALGMDVVTWSPNMTPERAKACGVTSVTLNDLLGSAHVVSLHLVPSPATRHLLNAETLALMSRDSILVNTSRAELIDMPALVTALQQGRLGFAGLDVFEQEPLPLAHPLRALDNALLTSHYGFICKEVLQTFAANVQAHLEEWLVVPSGDGGDQTVM